MTRATWPSNCLIFAIWMFIRHRDSYFIWRRSDYYPGPHFLWGRRANDGRIRVVHLVPHSPRHRLLPPPLFLGRLKRGDRH